MTRPPRRIAALASALLFALPVHAGEVTVFAAASLKTALDQIAAGWQAETGNTTVISYGGTPQLANQIEAGAPADIFVSAAVNWMDVLDQAGLLVPGSRRDLLGNTLVLVAHGAAEPVAIGPGFDLAGLLGGEKLAMALVDSVPAGVYGKGALENLGVWASVEGQVAQSDNVRAALALVATGEAPYGIVYGSDAVAEAGVTVVGTFPADSHPPIIYPAALIAGPDKPQAAALLDYLSSDAARAVFTAQGFAVLP
ncbi:molybdate ABC transporter substrate-binding protein [Fertoebacter nigrum]|uniref:Molybdate ABC transporter substrate-binding protein n=1 Tax=Fertoeibacter niger TaxID=2656921 RepID=A0A8X8KKN2_9RHOB|nr:molybdate ABC transporter substrate-binding protein [Fertoeibacter niger]NUB44464.1 molybdate ABC transporter substrate-binding protein [Fertoeibacter niger]